MKIVLLKLIECKRCSLEFYICNSCWRGHAYCSDECRQAARSEAHCISQRKYRQTEKGKEAHRQQEKNRRIRNSKKTVDDTSSTPLIVHDNVPVNLLFTSPCCHFCGRKGRIVELFPRRGYGGRYTKADQLTVYLNGG